MFGYLKKCKVTNEGLLSRIYPGLHVLLLDFGVWITDLFW